MFLIPFIGPLFGMVGSVLDFFKAKEDTKVKLDTNDVSVIQSRDQVIIATAGDHGIALARDFLIWPAVLYSALYFEGRIMEPMYPDLVWTVLPLDLPWETYMPLMAVYAFLLGLAYKGPR